MTSTSKPKKIWLLPTLLLLTIAGAWLVYRVMVPTFVPPVLPVPNGYDDLLQAAAKLAPRTGFYDEMEAEELASIVEQNIPALELARAALQKECLVTVDWSADESNSQKSIDQCQFMRQLARALAAAARQANAEGNAAEAIQYGLDSLQLATATARGGLVVDRMVSLPVRFHGLRILRNQVPLLSREECENLRKKLAATPRQLEPIDEVIRRDLAYVRQVHGAYVSFMMAAVVQDEAKQSKVRMQKSELRWSVYGTLLETHLALRAYQLDKGNLPEKLDDLVPSYLDTVPLDPFADGPLLYRPQADSYQLYSVGADKIDNGGVETDDDKDSDLVLEAVD